MLSQWDCFLKNLGEWHGSFTRLSPQGELLDDTPTIVSFEALENHTLVRQVVRRLPPNQPPQDKVLEYRSLNQSILFLEDGEFSFGSIQWSPFSEFGTELGLIWGERRLRLVQMFNKEGKLDTITLIREKLPESQAPERPQLTLDQLLGDWQGEGITLYRDLYYQTYPTHLQIHQIDDYYLEQTLRFSEGKEEKVIHSTAKISESCLYFEQDNCLNQTLLLPDGVSSTCPIAIQPRQSFILEVGWLITPTLRHRLIRRYDQLGGWVSVSLIKEEKQ